MLPTLDEFIKHPYPPNSYIKQDGFAELYLRKDYAFIQELGLCRPCITIGNMTAKVPGQGSFTKLVEILLEKDLAIYIQLVHNPRLRNKLLRMGFVRVNKATGFNYLINHEDKTTRMSDEELLAQQFSPNVVE